MSAPLTPVRRHPRSTVRRAAARRGAADDGAAEAANKASLIAEPWTKAPVAALVAHLIEGCHRPLAGELSRLEALARRVGDDCGEEDVARVDALRGALRRLSHELLQHMAKEEQVLFPWLVIGGLGAACSIRTMELEHDRVRELLTPVRRWRDDTVNANDEVRALANGLEALERDLLEHLRLEGDVLFPRALRGD